LKKRRKLRINYESKKRPFSFFLKFWNIESKKLKKSSFFIILFISELNILFKKTSKIIVLKFG